MSKQVKIRGHGESRSASPPLQYWNSALASWNRGSKHRLWRAHADRVNQAMINRWMGDDPVEVVLKTDLFDEAVGKGLLPMLTHCADQMIGMDVSALVVEAARGHCPDMTSYCADVRQIPLGDASVDLIVSPSSLDHFEVIEDFEIALRELHRVLRPNGRLIITMDNAANPAVAIRNALPFIWMQKTGLVRYKIGATCGPKALRKHLESVGFEVDFDDAPRP